MLALYAVAAHSELRRAVLGGLIGGMTVVAADIGKLLAGEGFGEVVPAWFFVAGVWAFGWWMRGRRFQTRELEDRAAQLEIEREVKARAAVAEERARISRELHDVIAHSVSVMVVQAQAAQRLLEGEQSEARHALGSIETTGRQALTEMRRLLGILRRTDGELALAPQPGLKSLDALIEKVRESGLPRSCVSKAKPVRCRPAWTSPLTGSSRRRSPTLSSTPAQPAPGWISTTGMTRSSWR